MSYDLYFTSPRISRDQFREYFSKRLHYKVSESQVLYQNEDTGVYFTIDHNEVDEGDPENIPSTASLNLNYYRPHTFGLEAADEIEAFIQNFGFSIDDPQDEGMGDGPFSKDGFIKAWNHGNSFGYSAILGREDAPPQVFTFATERLESIWKWNRSKTSIQESFSEDLFVPRIFFVAVNGKAASAAVWPDAISELVPHVDFLIVGRDELAPKTFFGSRKKDQFLIPFSVLAVDLQPYATSEHPLPACKLPTPVPEALRNRIRKLKPPGINGDLIPVDQVLNEELVAKYRKV